jgi:hypothetical protein
VESKYGCTSTQPNLEQHERNMCRERKLFVIAALQLLESHEREAYDSVVAPAEGVENSGYDIILSGFLKKGTKPTVSMSMSSGKVAGGYVWKSKYVELKHKEFTYFDDDTEDQPLMVSSQHSYHPPLAGSGSQQLLHAQWQSQHAASAGTKKVIPLTVEACACRIISLDLSDSQHTAPNPEDSGKTAFEICVLGGPRRVFRAGSALECARWVEAINTAMAGRGVSLPLRSDLEQSSRLENSLRRRHSDAPEKPQWSAAPGLRSVTGGYDDGGPSEGAAGPFAQSIAQYLAWQQHLHAIETDDAFRAAVRSLADSAVSFSVPVAYIRGKNADGRFGSPRRSVLTTPLGADNKERSFFSTGKAWLGSAYKPQKSGKKGKGRGAATRDSVAVGGPIRVEKTQMWKDLQRDEVCVNGERVGGTTGSRLSPSPRRAASAAEEMGGVEAIVGLLTRHIADAAEAAKASYLNQDHRASLEVVRESQIVQCARNVLMLCNRTQSGGDTYYCVDGLLNRARGGARTSEGKSHNLSSGLFILAPMSNKADPLEIAVDVVETRRGLFFPTAAGAGPVPNPDGRSPPPGLPPQLAPSVPATPAQDSAHGQDEAAGSPGGGGEDCIEALVASTAASSQSSPPARAPRRLSAPESGAVDGAGADHDDSLVHAAATKGADSNQKRAPSLSKGTRTVSGLQHLPRPQTKGVLPRPASVRSYKKPSTVAPQDTAKAVSVELSEIRAAESGAENAVVRPFADPVPSPSEFDSLTVERQQRRGSGRRAQLTLSLDDEGSNCDADGPPFAVDPSAWMGGSSWLSGDRHSVPVSVVCLDDAEDECGTDIAAAPSTGRLPSYPGAATAAVNGASGRDDTDATVISDITFDTTAAHSQSTTLADYQLRSGLQPSGPPTDEDSGSGFVLGRESSGPATPTPAAPVDKSGSRIIGKSLMKMFSSRLTPKLPQNNDRDRDAAPSEDASPASPSARAPSTATASATTPRVRGPGAATFLSVDKDRRLVSYMGTGRRKQSATKTAKNQESELSAKLESSGVGADAEQAGRADASCLCVRLRVRGVSWYRVCSADPQGDPAEDNWATVVGTFEQTFLVPACAPADPTQGGSGEDEGMVSGFERCRLALTERVVTIAVQRFDSTGFV